MLCYIMAKGVMRERVLPLKQGVIDTIHILLSNKRVWLKSSPYKDITTAKKLS